METLHHAKLLPELALMVASSIIQLHMEESQSKTATVIFHDDSRDTYLSGKVKYFVLSQMLLQRLSICAIIEEFDEIPTTIQYVHPLQWKFIVKR